MKIKSSADIVKRIMKISVVFLLVSIILIYCFSKDIIYSIIFILGFIVSISGFLVMIKMTVRYLKRGKGQSLFFLAVFFKMIIITGFFYLVSQVSKTAVMMYILGLFVVIAAIMTEAVYQFCGSFFKWKNTN